MAKEKVISSQMIFSGQILKLHIDTVSGPDGVKKTREIVDHSEAIVAVPVDSKGNILLVEQFRLAAGKTLLELPAGGIETGEDVEEAVRRELQEEIGYCPKTLMRMTGFYSAPGFSNEFLHLYLAKDLVPARLTAEDTDEIKVILTPASKISELITSGNICDAKTIAGLLFYLKFCQP